jgi:DNA-3-methyladenine glycosylase
LSPNSRHSNLKKLQKKFYERYVLEVAADLLGKIFVKRNGNNILSGRIVETEAYDGEMDAAAHSYNGKTKRNAVMFDGSGLLYVYFIYGVHYCANVVTGERDQGQAVLIRGIEPINGIEHLSYNRFGNTRPGNKQHLNLSNGPAKLCKAFNITKDHNGIDLTGNSIYILDADLPLNSVIIKTTRIGIKKSVDLPWRFYIKDNPFVSKTSV